MNQSDVRALALGLPEAEELPHFDRASFRVRGKVFATLPPGGDLVVLKLTPEAKWELHENDSGAIVSLGAWDKGGWTQLAIGRIDPDKLSNLIRLAWRQVAPKRLQAGS
ncbi:hypothetical protein BH11PSE2_BH11PSE2_07910 [soil metagenome]